MQSRRDEKSCVAAAGCATIWPTIAGTFTRIVGRKRAIFSKTTSAVQRSGKRTAAAPTANGKSRLEPVAYPKKSFGTESVTSEGPYPRACFA